MPWTRSYLTNDRGLKTTVVSCKTIISYFPLSAVGAEPLSLILYRSTGPLGQAGQHRVRAGSHNTCKHLISDKAVIC